MTNVSRRRLLASGGAAAAAGATLPLWTWAPSASIAGAGDGLDPEYVWDVRADPVIARLYGEGLGKVAEVNEILTSWTTNDQPLPAGLPGYLEDFIEEARSLPVWADQGKLKLAGTFNEEEYGFFLALLYTLGSGLISCAIKREAWSVYYSYGGANMRERIAKTTVLGYDVMDAQGWTASGSLLVNSVKTRMVHAAVRHLLPQSPRWASVGAGQEIPISQADILVTFHSLGTWVMKKFTEWDIAPGAELADAFLHAWNVDLHLLGVQDQYLPKDWAAAYAQYDQVMGPATGGTREGVELAQALLDAVIGEGNPLLRHELESLGRYVIGDAYADMIAFDRDPVLARVWAGAVPLLVRSYQSTVPDIPLVSHLLPEAVHTFIKIYFSPGDRAPITLPLSNRPE